MPGWTPDDRLRSIRDWTVLVLGSPPWRIRTQRQDMPVDHRPAVVVESASPPVPTRARVSVPQGNVEWQQGYSIMCYPEPGATPAASRAEADRVADLLTRAIVHGLSRPTTIEGPDGPFETTEDVTPPLRLPLFDYEGVPVEGENRAGPTEPYDWLWVADAPGARAVQDPIDHLLFTVPMDVRVSWESPGRVSAAAPIAESMDGGFAQP